MRRLRFYQWVLLIGALWNIAGGVAILTLTNWIFARDGLMPPSPRAYYYGWIALFMTFGIGYLRAAADPSANRSILLLGAIGKIAFAAIFAWFLTRTPSEVPSIFWIPVLGDLAFAVLFMLYLGSNTSTKARRADTGSVNG